MLLAAIPDGVPEPRPAVDVQLAAKPRIEGVRKHRTIELRLGPVARNPQPMCHEQSVAFFKQLQKGARAGIVQPGGTWTLWAFGGEAVRFDIPPHTSDVGFFNAVKPGLKAFMVKHVHPQLLASNIKENDIDKIIANFVTALRGGSAARNCAGITLLK